MQNKLSNPAFPPAGRTPILFLAIEVRPEPGELFRTMCDACEFLDDSEWIMMSVVSNVMLAFRHVDSDLSQEDMRVLAGEVRDALSKIAQNRFGGCIEQLRTAFVEVRGGMYATYTFINPGILNAFKTLSGCADGELKISEGCTQIQLGHSGFLLPQ